MRHNLIFKMQPEDNIQCAMYALYNAKAFQFQKPELEKYTIELWNEANTNAEGLNGKEMADYCQELFGAEANEHTTYVGAIATLEKGDGLIVRYKYGKDKTHYAFVYARADKLYLVNGHLRDKNGERVPERELHPSELKDMLVPATHKIEGEEQNYPWTWAIPKFKKEVLKNIEEDTLHGSELYKSCAIVPGTSLYNDFMSENADEYYLQALNFYMDKYKIDGLEILLQQDEYIFMLVDSIQKNPETQFSKECARNLVIKIETRNQILVPFCAAFFKREG